MDVHPMLVALVVALPSFVVLAPLATWLALPTAHGVPLRARLHASRRRAIMTLFFVALLSCLAGALVATSLGFDVVEKLN